jgi:hypothetical protein
MDGAVHQDEAQRRQARAFELPRLEGRALAAFRLIWVVVFAVAVVAVAVGSYRGAVRSSEQPFSHVGLGWYEEKGLVRLRAPQSAEAERSGIRRGGTILAIDGVPVGDSVAWIAEIDRLMKREEGATVSLDVRQPDGTRSRHVLTRRSSHRDEPLAGTGLSSGMYLWLNLATNLLPDAFLLVAAFVLFRGRRAGSVSALLSLALVLMAATGPAAWFFYNSGWLIQFRDLGTAASLCAFFVGLLAFPDGRFVPRWTFYAACAVALWCAFIPFVSLAARAPVGLIMLLTTAAALAQRYRRIEGDDARQQLRWATLGFVWGAILFAASILFSTPEMLRPETNTPAIIWLSILAQVCGGLGTASIAGGLLLSLLRYRLYDVDAVMSRSAAYGLLTAGFVALFAGSEKTIEILGEHYFEGGLGTLSGGVAAALSALVVVPLHNRMSQWAERRFQKRLMHLRRELPDAVADLREAAPEEEIVADVLERVTSGIRARHGAMLLDGRVAGTTGIDEEAARRWQEANAPDAAVAALDCDRGDELFPMRVPLRARDGRFGKPLGWLLLGPRPDGSFYGKDEQEALSEVADPVARALRVVRLRAEREARLGAEIEARLLDRIERRIAEKQARQESPSGKPSGAKPRRKRRTPASAQEA